MDTNKNQQKDISKLDTTNSKVSFDSAPMFVNKSFENYVFKRAEKVSLAVHLLCTLLEDNEPAKLRLKELSISLLTASMSLLEPGYNNQKNIQKILLILSETFSIFEIVQISRLISEMNCEIIKEEIVKVSKIITTRDGFYDLNGRSFMSKDFFNVPQFSNTLERKVQGGLSSSFAGTVYKGQKDIKDSEVSYEKNTRATPMAVHEDKNKRQEMILSMLKDEKTLTVKDFSKEIKGCSEKTIQRELLQLVGNKTLKKEGERRWSRYSLV